MRRIDVDWRVSSVDLDAIGEHRDLLGHLLEKKGVARLTDRFDRRSHLAPIMSSYHHLGTS